MNNFIFGKYVCRKNVLNDLDPRTKITFIILYFISIFSANTFIEFIVLIIVFFLIKYYSNISIFYLLNSFKVVFFLIFFTSIIHIIFNNNGQKFISLPVISIYSGAIISILVIIIRFFLVVSVMLIFNITTSPADITRAINKSLGFLKKMGINIDSFSLLVTISLRFIPTIADETQRIINAQVSRGANLKTGNIISKIKSFMSILVPVFISTLKRADELAIAMETRGYIPNKKRTKFKNLKYKLIDYYIYIFIIILTMFICLY